MSGGPLSVVYTHQDQLFRIECFQIRSKSLPKNVLSFVSAKLPGACERHWINASALSFAERTNILSLIQEIHSKSIYGTEIEWENEMIGEFRMGE